MGRMKVNIISTRPENCGIGATNDYLVEGMKPHLKDGTIELNQIYIEKPFSCNPFYFMKLAFQAIKNCDIIHVHYNHDCFGRLGKYYGFGNIFFYPILKLSGKPIITTFHEQPDLSNSSVIRKLFYNLLNWAPLNLSNMILTTTKKTKVLLIKGGRQGSKIGVLPLGASKETKKVKLTQCPGGIKKNKKIITLFGFINPNKGHHKIIEILDRLPDDYLFLIAGDARSKEGQAYKTKLKEMMDSHNFEKILFYGNIKKDEHPLIMGISDLIIFPYSDITSSLALTTAISYKKPILTSDIEPFKAFQKEHGCIETFKLNDKNDLKKKIIQCIGNNKRKKEMEKFIKDYNWDKLGQHQLNIYYQLYPFSL